MPRTLPAVTPCASSLPCSSIRPKEGRANPQGLRHSLSAAVTIWDRGQASEMQRPGGLRPRLLGSLPSPRGSTRTERSSGDSQGCRGPVCLWERHRRDAGPTPGGHRTESLQCDTLGPHDTNRGANRSPGELSTARSNPDKSRNSNRTTPSEQLRPGSVCTWTGPSPRGRPGPDSRPSTVSGTDVEYFPADSRNRPEISKKKTSTEAASFGTGNRILNTPAGKGEMTRAAASSLTLNEPENARPARAREGCG